MRLIIFLLLAACAWGQGFIKSPFQPTAGGYWTYSTTTFSTDAVTDYFILRWQQPSDKTLNKVQARVSAVTGTLGASDLVAEVVRVLPGAAVASSVTYTDASDLVNLTAHGFSNGDTVRFTAASGLDADLPDGMDNNVTYYVCNATANSFQIDNDSGCGSIVTDFSGSTGTQAARNTLAISTTVTSTPTGAAIVEFTGFSLSLSANKVYAVLINNANGTPGTNYPTWALPIGNAGATGTHLISLTSTAALTSTSNGTASPASFRLEFSDASFYGAMINGAASSQNVYDTSAAGARFPSFPVALNVVGVCSNISISGVPTSSFTYKIFTGANASESLAGTTGTISRQDIVSNGYTCAYFSSPVSVPANTVFRCLLSAATAGDTSSNRANLNYWPIADNATDKALFWNGLHKATCTLPCSAGGWTYTDTHVPIMGLILQDGSEVTAPTSTSGGSFAFVQ